MKTNIWIALSNKFNSSSNGALKEGNGKLKKKRKINSKIDENVTEETQRIQVKRTTHIHAIN